MRPVFCDPMSACYEMNAVLSRFRFKLRVTRSCLAFAFKGAGHVILGLPCGAFEPSKHESVLASAVAELSEEVTTSLSNYRNCSSLLCSPRQTERVLDRLAIVSCATGFFMLLCWCISNFLPKQD
jgi:hypothetical protein